MVHSVTRISCQDLRVVKCELDALSTRHNALSKVQDDSKTVFATELSKRFQTQVTLQHQLDIKRQSEQRTVANVERIKAELSQLGEFCFGSPPHPALLFNFS